MGTFAVGAARAVSGGGDFTPSTQYKHVVYKSATETLQQAIDRAPASAGMVQRLTNTVALANSTYAFPLSEKPTRVYINADELRERPTAFQGAGGTFQLEPGGLVTQNVWTWDAANSRVVVYDQGNAVTAIVCVDQCAVVALDAPSYEAVTLRPGVVLVGMGPEFSSIQPTVSAVDTAVPALAFHYALRAAQYAGVSGFKVVRNQYDNVVASNACAVLFPYNSNCDGFVMEKSEVVILAGVAAVNTSDYVGAIFFGSGRQPAVSVSTELESRAKGVVFRNCVLRSESRAWVMETASSLFQGTLTFVSTPIYGNWFLDGKYMTCKFFDSPTTNYTGEGVAHPEISSQEGTDFLCTTIGAAGNDKYPTEAYGFEFHNSPVAPKNPVGARNEADYTTIAWQGDFPIYVNSSNIGGEVSFADYLLAALTPAKAAKLVTRHSRVAPLRMTTFSTANSTPLVPCAVVDTAVSNSGTTERAFSQFRISYDELRRRKSAVVSFAGQTNGTANARLFRLYFGEVGTTPLAKETSVTAASTPFLGRAEIQWIGSNNTVMVNLVSYNLGGFSGVYQHSGLAAGDEFVLYFAVAGVASSDATIRDQRIELAY